MTKAMVLFVIFLTGCTSLSSERSVHITADCDEDTLDIELGNKRGEKEFSGP